MNLKVNESSSATAIENTKKIQQTDSNFKFTLISSIKEKDLQDKLNGLMRDINEQGDKLARHMDIRDMKTYRSLVKEFMNEVVSRSHEFSRENFLDRRGRHRVYGIVRLIDENLDELAKELMRDEKEHINILSKIDEIKGLLLDIAT